MRLKGLGRLDIEDVKKDIHEICERYDLHVDPDKKIRELSIGEQQRVEIANTLKKYDTIGIDLVAMCVNDLIVQGAKPLLFLDYISINKIDLKKLKSIIKGIIKGCEISNCELVGGETAEMPGTYEKGKFDIAGFSIGVVDQNKILHKKKIKKI